MAKVTEQIEKYVGSIENLAAAYYKTKAKLCPAPAIPKAEWIPPGESKTGHYTVGISKQEMVPDDVASERYYIAGYYGPKTITGMHDPQCATAIWIDDNAGRGALVLVSIDCVGFLRYDADVIRQRMAGWSKRHGCRAMHFFGTHDHAGIDTIGLWGKLPKSGRDKKFIDLMHDKICEAIETAYNTRRCGELYAGQIEEPEGYHDDYRLPIVYSKILTRLRFAPFDGGAPVYLVNYAAHPGMMGGKNREMSADWVYWFREDIKAQTGGEVIFINGLIGGLIYPHEEDVPNLEATEIAGHRIAELALAVENEHKLEPRIGVMSQDIYLACDNTLLVLGGILKVLAAKFQATGKGRFGLSAKTALNYFEIGDLRILTVPGEMFPELAYGGYLEEDLASNGGSAMNPTPLLEIANDPDLIMFGLGDDELGYLIPPNDFFLDDKRPYFVNAHDQHGRKHYEETVSVGVDAAQVIADTWKDMLERIRA
ncbi:MAG: hypothetical protein FWE98_05440 [Oscillospiraceae bacterium]|nr:hypothetical protein [Oscillospiraceae bacterium]